jgi:hypothetical protein
MAKRRTIGKDPLAANFSEPGYSAEIVPIAIAAAAPVPPKPDAEPMVKRDPGPLVLPTKARRVIGGTLEILGGDFGLGDRAIWPLRPDGGVGFVAPTGRRVDLGQDLLSLEAWPDRAEHRYLSATGWALVLASLGGVAGLLAGGLRLLEPRRMMLRITLSDGSKLVARTDSVTVQGLIAVAASKGGVTGQPRFPPGD